MESRPEASRGAATLEGHCRGHRQQAADGRRPHVGFAQALTVAASRLNAASLQEGE